jgi:hypothetical protein
MTKKNIARDGAKKNLRPIAVHDGARFSRQGQFVAGVSRTQAEHPIDDEPMIHQPTVAKNIPPAAPVRGHRSRRNDPLC